MFVIACFLFFVCLEFQIFASWLLPLCQYSSSKFPSFYPPGLAIAQVDDVRPVLASYGGTNVGDNFNRRLKWGEGTE